MKSPEDLIFISRINKDGEGVTLISKDDPPVFLKNDKLSIYSLSILKKTYIATDNFSFYVVKLVEEKDE
jgi:hypothetical protein